MRIKIVCGTYGYRDEKGILKPKTAISQPFDVEGQEGERLIAAGVAAACGSWEKEAGEGHADAGMEELKSMDRKGLVRMAKDLGIPAAGSKEELIARIMEMGGREDPADENMETAGDFPVLDAAEPEV